MFALGKSAADYPFSMGCVSTTNALYQRRTSASRKHEDADVGSHSNAEKMG